jgi:hypothetical protein
MFPLLSNLGKISYKVIIMQPEIRYPELMDWEIGGDQIMPKMFMRQTLRFSYRVGIYVINGMFRIFIQEVVVN